MEPTQRSVVLIITNNRGEVLLTQRGPAARDQIGYWENPGGGIEEGETSEEAARREAMEELGVEIELTADPQARIIKTPTVGVWHATIFRARLHGEPKIQDREAIRDMKWIPIDQLSTMKDKLASYTKEDFEMLGWILHAGI